MAPPSSRPQFPPGTRLNGRYEIRGVLGQGGAATVYDAFDLVIHREVAVKVVKPVGDSRYPEEEARSIERFHREARSAAQMIHPNVVTIFDMGVLSETAQPFIVMEKLNGRNLEEELKLRGPMDPRRALRLASRALDALAMGHDKGIVHRDLKPANLFIVAPGRADEDVRLLDFGIAFRDWGTRLSATGQLFGTARYLAPEYLIEQRVSPALDVYQMGLVLVEMLTGAPVMGTRKPGDCIYAHVHGELDVPARLLECPLGAVLQAALARDPGLRIANARVLRDVLDRINPNDIPRVKAGETLGRISAEGSQEAVESLHIGQTGPMGRALSMRPDPFGEDATVIGFSGTPGWLDGDVPSVYGEVTIHPAAARAVEPPLHRPGSVDDDVRSDHLARVALEVSARLEARPRPADESGGDRVVAAPVLGQAPPPTPLEDRSDKPVLMPSFGLAARRVAESTPAFLARPTPTPPARPMPDDATVEERVAVRPPPTTMPEEFGYARSPADYTATQIAPARPAAPPRKLAQSVSTRHVVIVVAVVAGVLLLIVAAVLALVLLKS